MNKVQQLFQNIGKALAPPSNLPAWQWLEENLTLDKGAAIPGRYSTDYIPFVRHFFNMAQDARPRRLTMMVSAQSAKTQNGINLVLHRIVEDPATMMWVMASKEHCDEFPKKRLNPAIENCPPALALYPPERNRATKSLVQFDTMNLLFRGSNSRVGLQSDPVRWLICDERREWRPGAIELVRKRTRTFHNFQEISMGTAGVKNDELHRDFLDGTQTFIHWLCPHCQHSQPFRFGRKVSSLFLASRERGGVVWETSEKTKPDGKWNWEAVRASVRYECESCGHLFANHEKRRLLDSWHPFDANPAPTSGFVSMHWNALYMPWSSCDWAELAVEFLKANHAQKLGKLEPMKAFVTETLGEPWEDHSEKLEVNTLRARCGGYKSGEFYPQTKHDKGFARIITVDVQNGYLVVVLRQWQRGVGSRLVFARKMFTFDDLRAFQVDHGVKDQCVWIDSGFDTETVYAECLKYGRWNRVAGEIVWEGWTPMKGEDDDYFTVQVEGKGVRRPFRKTHVDPFIGKSRQGQFRNFPLYLWSNPTYKGRLFFHILPKTSSWEIPSDISNEYLDQLKATEIVKTTGADGQEEVEFKRTGPDHFADCELMGLVVADVGGLV